MHNFCTLFDSHYLTRGLVMYRSLEATSVDFHLYVYAFDDLCHQVLSRIALPHMTVISLKEFEHEQLLRVKPTRSWGEYCWTCASHVIGNALDTFSLSKVTYLDADLNFYQSPDVLLDEFKLSGASILISPHRYTPCYDLSVRNGIYCVQFVTFRNDQRGKLALTWWQERCLEWCYNRNENGRFGDQKYLDDWPDRFPGVHVLTHLGGGVAPWNVQQYKVHHDGVRMMIDEIPMIFYHFHGYKFYADGSQNLGDYRLNPSVIDLLYRPYVHAIQSAEDEVRKHFPSFNSGNSQWEISIKASLNRLLRKLKGEYNVYQTL